jgi:mRNA-degrading endonuclease RelE of RelBE toxin-antitoxin system
MNYKIVSIPLFDKQAKRLSKKYPSLKVDLEKLIDSLQYNPEQGSPLGNKFYKIRLHIASKAKGKSGGARVITYVKVLNTTVYLTSIYDKSEKSTVTTKELEIIFRSLP